MYVRKKNNRSGTVSVVVVSKQLGSYKEIRIVGTSSKESEIEEFVRRGKDWIRQQNPLPDMFDQYDREKAARETVEYFLDHVENILLNGPRLILNRVYGLIGFESINDAILKSMAARNMSNHITNHDIN